MELGSLANTSLNVIDGVLVVSVRVELYHENIKELQSTILNHVYDQQIKHLIIDLSGVEIIDSFISRMLIDIAKMARLLGARSLFTGIRPEIVASLVDLGVVSDEVRIMLSINDGLRFFQSS